VVTPGGRTSTTTSSRTVDFLDPAGDKQDPANVVSILDTVTINGRSISSTWTAATRTMSTTSPEGRQGSTRFDVYGRVEEASSPGVLPVSYAYDTLGRLETVTQGARTTTYHYDADGYVEWIRDPLGREVHFTYDDAGRVRTQRLPDLRVIGFNYDANGNLTSVTPPGRPAHGFDHDDVDRATVYDPPQVTGVAEDRTLYAYNLDHQLELVTRPDGQLVDYVYGTSIGRLDLGLPRKRGH
jgi:YD repeat-containing protein